MRVIIACGGTAGHYLPALSFLDTLSKKAKDWDLCLALTKRNVEKEFDLGQFQVTRLSLVSVSRKINFKNLVAILKFIFGCFESLYLILRLRPGIVIGFGGYASFPLVLFSSLLGIKTVIHEQNVSPGISNKFLALFVNKVAVSFPKSAEFFWCNKNKIVFTGNPVRKDLSKVDKQQSLNFFGLAADKFTVLVMGGSQGSRQINTSFVKALSDMNFSDKIQIVHLCGELDYRQLKEAYGKMKYDVRLFDFLKEMKYAYSAADLAISRAGAGSINEIIFYQLPAVLVPYPYASGHQRENAKALQDSAACIIIEDKDFTPAIVGELINKFLNQRHELDNLRMKLSSLSMSEAAENLSDLVLSLS